jgi:hypothetical protein
MKNIHWIDWTLIIILVVVLAMAFIFPSYLPKPDYFIIPLVTLLSPVIAIRVDRFISSQNEEKQKKEHIFRTLMRTWANRVCYEHVEALNMIGLDFKKDKKIIDLWHEYLDWLKKQNNEIVFNKRDELLKDLLYTISQSLGYKFNKTAFDNLHYSPKYHEKVNTEQDDIRSGLAFIVNKVAKDTSNSSWGLPVTILDDTDKLLEKTDNNE